MRRPLPFRPSPLLLTTLAILLLFGLGIGNRSLWGYHEPYVAGIIREMAHSGDFVVPTLNGRPYLEKPPLFYAMGALVCRALGTFHPWALRFPSALLAFGTSLWAAFLAWRLGCRRGAAWAAFTLATSFLFFEIGQTAVVDMALTATVTFALGFAYLAILEPAQRSRWVSWFWAAVGATFMAKGVVGPLMVQPPLALTLLIRRDRDLFRAFIRRNWGVSLAFLAIAAWVALLALRGGTAFLDEVFLRNTLGRFLQHPDLVPRTGRHLEHVEPWLFYLVRMPVNVLPWTVLWSAALAATLAQWRRGPRAWFLPLAFLVNLVVFSVSEAKREVYLLPVLPITFLHLAQWLESKVPAGPARPDRVLAWTLLATVLLGALVAGGFPWVLVQEADLSPWLAGAMTAASTAFAFWAGGRLRRGDAAGAFHAVMVHWTLFLGLLLAFGVPLMDRQDWSPLQDPYRQALALREDGASLAAAGLTETQMGLASLTLHQVLPVLDGPGEVTALLGQGRPVAVLVGRELWARAAAEGARGTEVPTEADALPPARRARTPALVRNGSTTGAGGPPGPP